MNLQLSFLQLTRYFFILVCVIAFGVIPAVAQDASGILDDKVFVGSTGEKGKKADDQDELQFKNGRFRSVGCDEWGFGDTSYTAKTDGDIIKFQAVTVSPKHGKIEWDGTVKGDTLEATYVWTKKRWYWKDAHMEKWFNGSMNR